MSDGSGGVRRRLAGLLVVALLPLASAVGPAAGPAAGGVGPAATTGPAAVPARPPLLPPAQTGAAPTADGVRSVLAGPLGGPLLRDAAVSLRDATTGDVLGDARAADPVLPASTVKIVTAVAALQALDPAARLPTRVRAGARPGEVVLVGGGDVTLAGRLAPGGHPRPARLADLAGQVDRALGGTPLRRVLVDDTAYSGPRLGPGWRPGYVSSGNAMPVTALSVDAGRTVRDRPVPGRPTPLRGPRTRDPALQAGRLLARALGAPDAPVRRGTAPAGAAELGAVASPPVPALVEQMLTRSDNDLAESLARQVALARGRPASFAGAGQAVADVVAEVLSEAGPPGGAAAARPLRLGDGSGLSRTTRVPPDALARLLVAATRAERLAPVLTGLPVAGFDGTLTYRYRSGAARSAAGAVRGKTGTLSGVSALAGLVRTADGRLLAFALVAPVLPADAPAAERALDRAVAALAGCGCR